MSRYKGMIVVTGPTASGKTRRAVDIARAFDGEIVSADSRQLYRGMDLGTGKELGEYGTVPYHMIDIAQAGERLNLYDFLRLANVAIEDIRQRGKTPVVCGGSGMYVEALVNRLSLPQVPENVSLRETLQGLSLEELTTRLASMKQLHNVTDVDTCKRAIRAIEIAQYMADHPDVVMDTTPHPASDTVIIGVEIDRDSRRQRITQRLKQRLDDGMVEEVRRLMSEGVSPDDLIYYGLEYKYLTLYVTGQLTYQEMFEQLERAIHQFAKRQMTWFRGMERRGLVINWLPWSMDSKEFVDKVGSIISKK